MEGMASTTLSKRGFVGRSFPLKSSPRIGIFGYIFTQTIPSKTRVSRLCTNLYPGQKKVSLLLDF